MRDLRCSVSQIPRSRGAFYCKPNPAQVRTAESAYFACLLEELLYVFQGCFPRSAMACFTSSPNAQQQCTVSGALPPVQAGSRVLSPRKICTQVSAKVRESVDFSSAARLRRLCQAPFGLLRNHVVSQDYASINSCSRNEACRLLSVRYRALKCTVSPGDLRCFDDCGERHTCANRGVRIACVPSWNLSAFRI